MSHIDPDDLSRLSDFSGSKEAVESGTGSQIKDRVTFMNRRMGKRVPAAKPEIRAIRDSIHFLV
jgi:hypothetical protein